MIWAVKIVLGATFLLPPVVGLSALAFIFLDTPLVTYPIIPLTIPAPFAAAQAWMAFVFSLWAIIYVADNF